MATDTQTATALLDEATAIMEAEWIRPQHEADLWREIADLFAETPAPRPAPNHGHHPASAAGPTAARRSTPLASARLARTQNLGYPALSSVRPRTFPKGTAGQGR